MVNLIHAARIAAFDDVFFPPETDVILTTTISDEELATYTFQDELAIISELQPEYVIPFDLPVYADMQAPERQQNIDLIATRTRDMDVVLSLSGDPTNEDVQTASDILEMPAETIAALPDTTVLPLIKGHNPIERQPLLETAAAIDAPCIVKYGVQYMTVGGGNYPELVSELETINEESNGYPTLVIGMCSPSGMFSLEGVPDNIVAAAGTNQWISHVEPHTTARDNIRELYYSLSNDVAQTLAVQPPSSPPSDTAQTPCTPFISSPGKSVSDSLQPTNAGAAGDPEYGFKQRKRPSDAATPLEAGLDGAVNQNTSSD